MMICFLGSPTLMMCKPTVLADGTWALPTCDWYTDHSSGVTVSTDGGKTWSFRGSELVRLEEIAR